jgi:hypothetical protein
MPEHRKGPRKIFLTPVTLSLNSAQTHATRSYDLGSGGMALIVPVRLSNDETCTLGFEFDPHDAEPACQVSAQARIAWCLPCAQGFKIGLQFIELQPAELLPRLQRFVNTSR